MSSSLKARLVPGGLVCALAASLVGCAVPGDPLLVVSPDRSAFDGSIHRVVLTVHAWTGDEKPGAGVVRFESAVGTFVGGDEVTLVDGFATVTFACQPDVEPACVGPVRLQATWGESITPVQLTGYVSHPITPVEWDVVPTGVASQLFAVASTREVVWAVGERGTVLRFSKQRWERFASGTLVTLRAVTLDAAGFPVAVGDDGVVIAWDGAQFVKRTISGEQLTAVAFDAHQVLHVGAASGVVFCESQGGGFETAFTLAAVPVRSLVSFGGELWATAEGSVARKLNDWEMVPPPVSGTLALAFAGETTVYLAGQRGSDRAPQGLVLTGPMPAWKSSALPEPVIGVVEVPLTNERFVFGATKLFRQVEPGGTWDPIDSPSPALAGASRAPGDLVLVGPAGISLVRRHN
ncbi:MAG: hypothetical protein U0228_18005 [Myxococcaceae bacterium]